MSQNVQCSVLDVLTAVSEVIQDFIKARIRLFLCTFNYKDLHFLYMMYIIITETQQLYEHQLIAIQTSN